jgi:hypothetical protein
VIDRAVGLLEARVVLLVDDDEAEPVEREEQRRAGADHDRHPALGHEAPGAAALGRGQGGVPGGRRGAEAALEPGEPLRGERDLRQEDEDLPPAAQRLGHGLEVDLRLAGTRDALEQEHGRPGGRHRRREPGGAAGLVGGERHARHLRVGERRGVDLDQPHRLEQPASAIAFSTAELARAAAASALAGSSAPCGRAASTRARAGRQLAGGSATPRR